MILLYSNNCPRCTVLEAKLKNKNIKYEKITNIEIMQQKGIDNVPVLEKDGQLLSFNESIKFVQDWGE